jgi:valyl-tRNA synthetase
MLHPFMPFVTEEAWQRFGTGESVLIAPWPEANIGHADPEAERRFGFTQQVVSEIRRFRKAHGLKDSMTLEVRAVPDDEQRDIIEAARPEIVRLANLSALEILSTPGDPVGCARLVADGAQLLVPLAGVLDRDVERARLSKKISEIEANRARAEAKLASDAFVRGAPGEIVDKERSRLAALREEAAALSAQRDALG